MATASESLIANERGGTLNVPRLIIAGGLTAAGIFVLCWLGTLVPFSSPTHAYISLFTNEDVGSVAALVQGACWSLLFGALVGGAFAVIYNATAGLERR